jgi:hypothetical protein
MARLSPLCFHAALPGSRLPDEAERSDGRAAGTPRRPAGIMPTGYHLRSQEGDLPCDAVAGEILTANLAEAPGSFMRGSFGKLQHYSADWVWVSACERAEQFFRQSLRRSLSVPLYLRLPPVGIAGTEAPA